MISLTTPYRTVVGVLVVWVTEQLLNMRKLNPPSAQKIAKKTDTMVVDGLTQSSATLTMLILPHTLTLVATETMGLEI